MKKLVIILLVLIISVSLAGCKKDEFAFKSIDDVEDLKCFVSTDSFTNAGENSNESGGIDDGSGQTGTVIEDPVIKGAYNLLASCSVKTEKFDIKNDQAAFYLLFYTGDHLSYENSSDNVTVYGAFVVAEDGAFKAMRSPEDKVEWYYKGDSELYGKILDIISKCKY